MSIHSKSARRRRGSRPNPPYQSSVQYSCCWARRWSHSSRSRTPPGISSARTDLRPTRTRCRSTGRFHALMIFVRFRVRSTLLGITQSQLVQAAGRGRSTVVDFEKEPDVGTVDRRVVGPVKNQAPCARTICWERCARISSWPGCNSSLFARGRIHSRKLLLTAERKTSQRRGGPYIFCLQLLQGGVVEHQFRQQLLQLPILVFQHPQPLALRHL